MLSVISVMSYHISDNTGYISTQRDGDVIGVLKYYIIGIAIKIIKMHNYLMMPIVSYYDHTLMIRVIIIVS